MQRIVAELVRDRIGAFRRSEALAAGCTEAQVRSRLKSGEWRTLRAGVYAERFVIERARRHDDSHHALQAEALVLATEGTAMSHGSAVRRYGLAHLNDIGARLHVSWSRTNHRKGWVHFDADVMSSELPKEHVLTVGGVGITTPARTVADIARDYSFLGGVVVGDSALAVGLTTRAEIDAVLATMYRWPGVRQARRVSRCLDARAQNPLESIGHAVWSVGGLPAPELQVWVYDAYGFVGVLDGLWPDHFVGYELDGAVKYRELGQADTLLREKARQERLENAGLLIRRFTWTQLLTGPRDCVKRIRDAFAEAATRRRPRVRLYAGHRDVPAPSPVRSDEPDGLGTASASASASASPTRPSLVSAWCTTA